jgi:heptaprenyl diphosphate synthase
VSEHQPDKNNVRVAILSAFAVSLHCIEALIPAPLPWLRFGFSNIVTLTALDLYGFKTGMMITIIRTTIGSLLRGTLLGPAFVLSFSGGVVSTFAMWGAQLLGKSIFSAFGISMIGSISHTVAQLFMAYLIFVKNIEALSIISSLMLFIGTLTGALNGLVVSFVIKKVKEHDNNIKTENVK